MSNDDSERANEGMIAVRIHNGTVTTSLTETGKRFVKAQQAIEDGVQRMGWLSLEVPAPPLLVESVEDREDRFIRKLAAAMPTDAKASPPEKERNPRQAGRNPHAATGIMFQALAAVMSTTLRRDLESADQRVRFITRVLDEFDARSPDTRPHSHYERYLRDFVEEYMKPD